jgi:PIN domain nuclease of toxin-antitoxin system
LKLLLDSHTLLWVAAGRLKRPTRAAIESADQVFVSAATIWEIEIKRALRRLAAPADIVERVDGSGFDRLPITFEHAREAARLPMLHADPFDRLLVAQARLEGLTLVTADHEIVAYDVAVLEAS